MSQRHTTVRRNPLPGLSRWPQHGGSAGDNMEECVPTRSHTAHAANHAEAGGDPAYQTSWPVDGRTRNASRPTVSAVPGSRAAAGTVHCVPGGVPTRRRPSSAGLDDACRTFRSRFAGSPCCGSSERARGSPGCGGDLLEQRTGGRTGQVPEDSQAPDVRPCCLRTPARPRPTLRPATLRHACAAAPSGVPGSCLIRERAQSN